MLSYQTTSYHDAPSLRAVVSAYAALPEFRDGWEHLGLLRVAD